MAPEAREHEWKPRVAEWPEIGFRKMAMRLRDEERLRPGER